MSKKVRLAGSVALLAFLAWRTDWRQIAGVFAGLRVGWWIAAVILYASIQMLSSVRWRLLARPLGFGQSRRRFLAYYYIGMFFNLVLPTAVGGDVVRAWYLDGGSGNKRKAFLSVFTDRVSGLLMLIAIACVAAVCYPFELPPRAALLVYGAGAGAVVGLVLMFRWAARAPSGLGQTPAEHSRLDKLLHLSRAVRDALIPTARIALVTTFLSVILQAANVIVLWLAGQALGVSVPPAYYWILAPVVTLMTMFPISLNGMGVREWGMVLLLAPLGVGQESATALSLLWFLTFSAVSVAGGGCYLFGRFPRFEVRPDDDSVGCGADQGREGQHQAAA